MKVHELINILRAHDPSLEVFCCSEDNIWSVTLSSFREATLLNVEKGDITEEGEYDPEEDGAILSKNESLIIDLDL